MTNTMRTAWLLLILLPVALLADDRQGGGADGYPVSAATSVDEAVAQVSTRLQDQGFDIVGIIDHAANAFNAGFDLLPTQLILFSHRKIDRELIRRGQTAAIDLPQKFLIWEDHNGDIRFNYNAAGYLSGRHDMPVLDPLLAHVSRTLGQFGDLDDGLVSVQSQQSVADTVAKLEDVLLAASFFIPFVIDYPGQLAGCGQGLRPTTLIVFGNPAVGSQLMLNSRPAGLDLPQKFLVWEDCRGDVRITYNDPFFVAKRHAVQGLDTLLGNIANALANFAHQGATP